LLSTWRTLIAGFILGSLITAGVVTASSIAASQGWQWEWRDWTGFGAGTTIKKSTTRLGGEKGKVERVTTTEEPQPGKTLWDILELSGSLAVPFLLIYLGTQIQKKEKDIAYTNLREEALQRYLDRVSEILIDKNVSSLDPNDASLETIKDVVRTRTLTVLRSLDNDGERKGSVIRFLVDADLLGMYFALDLSYANLQGAKLKGVNLSRAHLNNADLSDADLSDADLSHANLHDVNLSHADLSDVDLSGAELYNSNLDKAILVNAELTFAKLNGANFKDADLKGVTGLEPDQAQSAINLVFTSES
jgi:uncharacterized protein YjbI with pentapeptide repeats